jgi:hypothetical protein
MEADMRKQSLIERLALAVLAAVAAVCWLAAAVVAPVAA